jgi:hypothetical protein
MTTPTVPVTVTLTSIGGPAKAGITVTAKLDRNEVYQGIVISDKVEGVTDANGVTVLNCFPNAPAPTGLGTKGSTYRFTAKIPNARELNERARVPDNGPCRLEDILIGNGALDLSDAEIALLQVQAAVSTATAKANQTTEDRSAVAEDREAVEEAIAEAQAIIPPVLVADYTALRAYTGLATKLDVTGYLVTAEPSGVAGQFVRDDEDTTTADNGGTVIVDGNGRRWKRVITDGIHVDWFGAKGIFTDDGPALSAASAVINENGGGTLVLRPGAVYGVGGQALNDPAVGGIYTFYPNQRYPIEFTGCTKMVTLRGNGATIKCLDNVKYGAFNTDGTVMESVAPYFGAGASTPYFYMIYAHGNTGGVHLENIELDGNLLNIEVGGVWGDTGIQLQATGYHLDDNTGPVSVKDVITHHHGADGYILNGPADALSAHNECGTMTGVRAYCNGRQGMSMVGGRGWTFNDCSFNYTGKASPGSDTLGPVHSNPGAGADFEAESGKYVLDPVFNNCEFIANNGQGIVADTSGRMFRAIFNDCTFIGTTNYAMWAKRPGFKFYRCRIYGTCVNFNNGNAPDFDPNNAAIFEDCFFSNDVTLSPTGALYDVNDLTWENANGCVAAYRCTFEHHLGSITGGVGTTPTLSIGDGPNFYDCVFIAKAGQFGIYGTFYGHNWFVEDGGTLRSIPGAETPGATSGTIGTKVSGGPSYGPWYFRTADTNTMYPATHDEATLTAIGIRTYASDANVTLTHKSDFCTQILSGTLTANRTITLSGGRKGASFYVVRTGGGAFTWDVGGLKTLTAPRQWCRVEHTGSAWVLVAFGHLDAQWSLTADVGNAPASLTVGTHNLTNIWNTPLTADRAVTLNTTGAYAGARFRIIRTAAATGSFNLNVGTGPLKALKAGQWCDVEYNGTAWVLAAYGQLTDGGTVSADKGDAAATLTAGSSEQISVWSTPLTADRAVTLSTAGAYNGASFRVVRTAAATGAFNLNVGTGPLKALAAGQWCDVHYNGSAWVLTASGSL